MRESVCVVLNEREPIKAKFADTLIEHLKQRNITTSRIEISAEMSAVLKQRRPKVVVMDYLLGDHSSGLDVQASLGSLSPLERPAVLFVTDEPSVHVAVTAMHQGAIDYIELEHSRSLSRCLERIEQVLLADPAQGAISPEQVTPTLDELIADSPSGQALHAHLRTLASLRPPLLLMCGARGVGLSTLSRAFHQELPHPGLFQVIDVSSPVANEDLLGPLAAAWSSPKLTAEGSHVAVLDHIEEDDGAALRAFLDLQRSGTSRITTVVLLSTNEDAARLWGKALGIPYLDVPSLEQRREDITPLAQKFYREAVELGHLRASSRPPALDSETVVWMAQQEWRGNIKQLRSTIIDSVIRCAHSRAMLRSVIEEMHSHALIEPPPVAPSALAAAAALFYAGGSTRLAAARIGCSRQELHAALASVRTPWPKEGR